MEKPEHLRIVHRLAMDFIVTYLGGVVGRSNNPLDIIDVLILMTVVVGNTDHFRNDPSLSVLYGSAENPVPTAARRPMSRLAVAQALGLTRETSRRKINRLVEMGLLEETGRGVVILISALGGTDVEDARQAVRLLRNLVRSLRQQGIEV